MDSISATIESAVKNNNYDALAAVFSTHGPQSWQNVGQGEQRSLAAHFVKAAVSSGTFLPQAFGSMAMVNVMNVALGHLPSTVENAADSKLRQMLFDYKVNEDADFTGAARILGNMRMDDSDGSVYYVSPAEKCNVYVKIAECFLEEDETVDADAAVTKAGTVVESIPNPEQHTALILRYKSTYARVLDANRKFLQAASRYHDLSQSSTDLIDTDDLLQMLGRAATCAILAPSGPQRQRVLGLVFKDPRLHQLDAIPSFEAHSAILSKMYKHQVLRKEELTKFESSLATHQQAMMGDGLTIMERSVIEQNMIAVSKLYRSIYFTELGLVLGVSRNKAEKVAATMIMDGGLNGSIDQVDGILNFEKEDSPQAFRDKSITSFCGELNRISDMIQAE